MKWLSIFGPVFGPALIVFAVYAAAKWGPHREPCIPIHDVRPYDARKLEWRNRQ
jgi:hypothetical protein